MAPNMAPRAPNITPVAHNITTVAPNIAPVAPPSYSLYIKSPPPHAVAAGSKVSNPRGRCEIHENIHSFFSQIWFLTFSIRCVLR